MAYSVIDIGDASSVDDVWGTSDTLKASNIEYGGRFAALPFVVATLDGSLAADGNPITNPSCNTFKLHHNGAESLVRHTDAQVLAYDNLWATGGAFNDVSYADYLAHLSGALYSYLRWKQVPGYDACCVESAGLYEDGTELTVAEDAKNQRYWKQGDCGAGWGAVYDEDGTLLINLDKSVEYDSI